MYSGYTGSRRGELEPSRAGRRLEPFELRPRRLGVDVVDRHRRHAAPVVDARIQQSREVVVGEVRRRLDVHLRPEHEPRDGGRPQQVVERRLRRVRPSSCWASPGSSGRSPPGCARSARGARGSRAARRSAPSRVSPMPMRIPVVNGMRSSPASRSVSSRTAGRLSGEPKCGPPRSDSRSDAVSSMIPCEAVTSRSAASSSRVITPGFACGSSPVSSSTSRHMRRGIRSSSRSQAQPAPPARRGSGARACRRA